MLSERDCREIVHWMRMGPSLGVQIGDYVISIVDTYGRHNVVRFASGKRIEVRTMWQKDLVELIRGADGAKVVRL